MHPAGVVKITLLSEDSIRLDPLAGPLTVEAPSEDVAYSPFQMLASGLATCTASVLQSWGAHAEVATEDLSLEVRWRFADDPHRMSDIELILDWPSLPPARLAAAKRVAELCTIHATLSQPPAIGITVNGEQAAAHAGNA